MTLLERAQSLGARAKSQREQEAREEVAKNVRTRTTNLEKNLEQLAVARARATALQEAGHDATPWPTSPVSALAAYSTAPVSVGSLRQSEWEKFVLALGKFAKKVEENVAQDIKRARKSALDGVSLEDLRGYLQDPATEKTATQLISTLESLRQKTWEDMSGPALLRVLQDAKTFREEVVRLRETGASEALLQFLGLARNDGAPLVALTDPLRKELKDRKLLDRLRLILPA